MIQIVTLQKPNEIIFNSGVHNFFIVKFEKSSKFISYNDCKLIYAFKQYYIESSHKIYSMMTINLRKLERDELYLHLLVVHSFKNHLIPTSITKVMSKILKPIHHTSGRISSIEHIGFCNLGAFSTCSFWNFAFIA